MIASARPPHASPHASQHEPPPASPHQLEQIVAGLSEGVVLIDPDRRMVWANDAALALHGVARLEDLGRTVDEYRANFVLRHPDGSPLDPGQHPLDRVLAGEAFEDVVVEVRHRDRRELDWTHRLRGLVIRDAAGRAERLALIVDDATGQAEAERRFERMFAANPAPAAICRLADLRFVKLNDGFLELTGYAREDVLGRTVYEVDVLRGAEQRALAVERLRAGETIPQMEAVLEVPRDAEHFVIVAGQPIEIGDEPCMLFTFADLEDRARAEAALRRSEERFARAFQLSPIPAALIAPDAFRLVDANESFARTFGYDREEVGSDRPPASALWVDADDERRFLHALEHEGQLRAFEAWLHSRDGGVLGCLISAVRVRMEDGDVVLCTIQDVTERRRSENELVAAIEAVMTDASWFGRGVVEKLAALKAPRRATGAAGDDVGLADLTAREREVLGLISRGSSDPEIAAALGMARNTVRNHLAALYRKLGVHRRSALVIWARERAVAGADADAESGALEPRRTPRGVSRKHQKT